MVQPFNTAVALTPNSFINSPIPGTFGCKEIKLSERYPGIDPLEFMIMLDHVHGIVAIADHVRPGFVDTVLKVKREPEKERVGSMSAPDLPAPGLWVLGGVNPTIHGQYSSLSLGNSFVLQPQPLQRSDCWWIDRQRWVGSIVILAVGQCHPPGIPKYIVDRKL
jgi:hypothetical protein